MGICHYCSKTTRPNARFCGNLDDSVCCECAHGKTGNYGHSRPWTGQIDVAPNFYCKHCSSTFAAYESLKQHVLEHHGHKCTLCSKAFATPQSLEQHVKSTHVSINLASPLN